MARRALKRRLDALDGHPRGILRGKQRCPAEYAHRKTWRGRPLVAPPHAIDPACSRIQVFYSNPDAPRDSSLGHSGFSAVITLPVSELCQCPFAGISAIPKRVQVRYVLSGFPFRLILTVSVRSEAASGLDRKPLTLISAANATDNSLI